MNKFGGLYDLTAGIINDGVRQYRVCLIMFIKGVFVDQFLMDLTRQDDLGGIL